MARSVSIIRLSLLAAGLIGLGAQTSAQGIDPETVRSAASAAGLGTLADVPVPVPDLRAAGVLNPDNPDADQILIQLGKALFWDQEVGSDGQACASCHFHAGADNRAKNQLDPDTRNVVPDPVFGNSTLMGVPGYPDFGPNYELAETDFPFHVLADPEENNFNVRVVLQDTNDVASSQGVFDADFGQVTPVEGDDAATPVPDDIFNVAGVNARRVAQRNAPSVINAVFNHSNFWDGRAHNTFNGVSTFGPPDPDATILVNNGALNEQPFAIVNSSLASQAVAPPPSRDEMSFDSRPFAAIGKKMVNRRPLRLQLVHADDSVLGPLARTTVDAGDVTGVGGLKGAYAHLIKAAFAPKYWNSATTITFNHDGTRNIGGTSPDAAQVFSQMEANFSLFFGLSVQAYQAALVSEQTPFDLFIEGDNQALDEEQLHGLLVFLNAGSDADRMSRNPPAVDDAIAAAETALGVEIGAGNCVSCHGGPEFTDAAFTSLAKDGELELIELEETPELVGGLLAVSDEQGLLDNGFSNIGVRPTNEDLARGGEANGFPLSFTRQALEGHAELLPEGAELPCASAVCPRTQVDGAFKVPGLRNVEITGPYFHNGGQATLAQVIEFYDRQSDFGAANIADLDRNMAFIDIDEPDEEPLVAFLLALTDERVRNKLAPFDHPQLFVPDGHPGDQVMITCTDPEIPFQACTDLLEIPAVGVGGLPAAGLEPLATFLGLEHLAPDPTMPPAPPAAAPPLSSPASIQVAFKLDPRITGGLYMGARYVSAPVFRTARQGGSTLTLEARAQHLGATGGSLGISADWTPANPALADASPRRGQDVTLTIRCGGPSGIRVASQQAVRELRVQPICGDGTIQAEISQ